MKLDKLNEIIPYAKGGKEKILRMSAYPHITLAMPGRHAQETKPVGGDFCVMVTDINTDWDKHQFTHTDLFKDIELKTNHDVGGSTLIGIYYEIILGDDPDPYTIPGGDRLPGIYYKTFLYAAQCLAVAEHRRYSHFVSQGGGRYLPFRFAAGIAEG